jgi:hypothetical protein
MLIFRATSTMNTTRERLEAATVELQGTTFLGQPLVLTLRRIPKKVVTGATEGTEVSRRKMKKSGSIRQEVNVSLKATLKETKRRSNAFQFSYVIES